jgi:hypothetical protein
MSDNIERAAQHYTTIYTTIEGICKEHDTTECPLTLLHTTIQTGKLSSKHRNKGNESFNHSLDLLYKQCTSICSQTNSTGIALPVLQLLVNAMVRGVRHTHPTPQGTPPC